MIIVKTRERKFKGTGFKYAHTITDEGDIIKGVGLFLFSKLRVTITGASTLWTDDAGKPFWFRVDEGVFFFLNWSVSLKTSRKRREKYVYGRSKHLTVKRWREK